MKWKNCTLVPVLAAAFCCASQAMAAPDVQPDFFSAALCQPPLSLDSAKEFTDAAKEIGELIEDQQWSKRYRLPESISRDGFIARDIEFGGSAWGGAASISIGVVIDGHAPDEVAKRYNLAPDTKNLLEVSPQGFLREVPNELPGQTVVVAVPTDTPNQTRLACWWRSPT